MIRQGGIDFPPCSICLYETVTEDGVTKNYHYLTAANGLFAIFVTSSNGEEAMHYTLKDHQGSLAAVIHPDGDVERLSYDAWGRRRNADGFGYGTAAEPVEATFDRGFTLHEHYDDFGLINMNGRLYDPALGRMLSPDIVIQQEHNSQAYNRYSYCFNNPLRFTDPSGYVVENPPYYFMLLNQNKHILKDYYGVEPTSVEYSTDDSEGTQRINVSWKYEGNEYQASWVHHNVEGKFQEDPFWCQVTCEIAQEERFSYGKKLSPLQLAAETPGDKGVGVRTFDGWTNFERQSNVFHSFGNYYSILQDPFNEEIISNSGNIYKHTFDEMNKGNGVSFHYELSSDLWHCVNASDAIKYYDGKNKCTTYDIFIWNPDPVFGGKQSLDIEKVIRMHTLKLEIRHD